MWICKKNISFFFISFLGLIFSCNAPRENPFDPAASNYKGKIKTTIAVNRLFSRNEGISNVRVTSDELRLSELTNSAGQVIWHHDFIDSIKILIEKDGFFSDTLTFSLRTEQNDLSVFLNAKPQLLESNFISLYSPSTLTNLELRVKIFDEDGVNDFTTVYLKQENYNFVDTLLIDEQIDEFTKNYRTFFSKNKLSPELGDQSIPEMDFQIYVQNSNGDFLIFQPFSVRRVIKKNLVLNTPIFNQRISGNIEFSWEKINENYSHHYKVFLYQFIAVGFINLVGEFSPISSDDSSFILSDLDILNNLSSGEYIWQLWVQDQVGNICKSNSTPFFYTK